MSTCRSGAGLAPAAPMPTSPATRMQMHDGMQSHESWSSVRGNESRSVGIAKMPVYHIRQSLFSERTPRLICPASSCDPVAQMAKMTVPAARISRTIGPPKILPASPMLWTSGWLILKSTSTRDVYRAKMPVGGGQSGLIIRRPWGEIYTEEGYQNHSWHDANYCCSSGKRQHAVADDLGDHENGDEWP